MKILITVLLFSLTFIYPKPPRQPKSLTPEQLQARWYMAEDGHAVKCTGKPHLVRYHTLNSVQWELRLAVLGCSGKSPQIILKD